MFVFLSMIFLHIVDDYYCQGLLTNLKQRKWWEENAPDKMYRYDYIWALLMHSFSWSFMVMLPLALFVKFEIGIPWLIVFAANIAIHGFVDHLKANKRVINLWTDQIIHIAQIGITFAILR